MKKIYSIALAATVAMSASAADQLSTALVNRADAQLTAKKVKVAQNTILDNSVKTLADDDATSIENLAGEYTWSFYNYLNGTSGGWKTGTIEIIVEDASKGEVTVDLNGWEVKGSYDATNAQLTIETGQDLGYNEYNQIQVYLYHGVWTSEGKNGGFVDEPFEITFTGEGLEFATIEGTGDLAGEEILVDCIAIGNSSLGWFLYAGENEAAKKFPFEEEMPEGDWVSVGKGMFTDGWQTIAYVDMDYLEELYQWEVEVEQNSLNPSLYRIHNPYNVEDFPFYDYNADMDGTGNIVFSVEDPEFVTVYPHIYSGLADDMGSYLNTNLEGFYSIIGGYDKEVIIAAGILKEGVSNYADGKVTFYNCRFGTTDEPDKAYNWQDNDGNSLIGPSYLEIELPHAGVNVISIDDSNAPVEYFNLQGMRVAEPVNGLYIVRQGNKVSKQVVK